jgi:hypothetical protein
MALLGSFIGSSIIYRNQQKLHLATCSDNEIRNYISSIEANLKTLYHDTSNYWNPQKALSEREKNRLEFDINKATGEITLSVTGLISYIGGSNTIKSLALEIKKLSTGGSFQEKTHKIDKQKAFDISDKIHHLNQEITSAHFNIKVSKNTTNFIVKNYKILKRKFKK